jgi:hypothetical protein
MRAFTIIFFSILSATFHAAGQGNIKPVQNEAVYLHTDRDIYIAGEYLFYKLYLQGNPAEMSRYAYLLIRDKNNSIVTHAKLEANNRISFGHILLSDTLSSGYYQILCYTNLMRNAEESVFKKEIIIANRFDEKLIPFTGSTGNTDQYPDTGAPSINISGKGNLTIRLEKQSFKPRERISFSIGTGDISPESIRSISVSVSEIISGIEPGPTVSDYFRDTKSVSRPSERNTGLCTFYPEFTGSVLQGTVAKYPGGSDPGNASTVLISTTDTIVNLQYAMTDSLGRFLFILNPYYDGKELFIKLRAKENGNIRIDDKTISQLYLPSQKYNIEGIKEYLVRSGKIVQIQRFYNYRISIDTEKVFLPSKTVPGIFYKNYLTIKPSDYLELPDFIEISREIVPGFKVRKTRNGYVSGYSNIQYQSDKDDEPTIFLDGVPIDNVNQIISFGTRDIKSIETVPVIRHYGGLVFPGILAVRSNNLIINNIQFYAPAIRYQALSSRSFTRPKSFNPASLTANLPDLRQLLLWEPELKPVNGELQVVECFASDLRGLYRINVQGITSDGLAVNGSAIIKVQSE